MKRTISILLAACLALTLFLTACGNDKEETPPAPGQEEQTTDAAVDPAETASEKEILVPAKIFQIEKDYNPPEDVSGANLGGIFAIGKDDDAAAYAQANQFDGAVWGEDGSLTLSMSKARYEEWEQQLIDAMEAMVEAILNDEENAPYLTQIEYEENVYTEFLVEVDRAGFDAAEQDWTPLRLALCASYYQAFLGKEPTVKVDMADTDTSEILKTEQYPDAFELTEA